QTFYLDTDGSALAAICVEEFIVGLLDLLRAGDSYTIWSGVRTFIQPHLRDRAAVTAGEGFLVIFRLLSDVFFDFFRWLGDMTRSRFHYGLFGNFCRSFVR